MEGHPWDADHDLDAEQVREGLLECFPELAPMEVSPLGEGWDFRVFEVNGEFVFRFPKRAEVDAELELRVVPMLQSRLPLQVPGYCFSGGRTEAFPHGFVGYRRLAGVIAKDIPEAELDQDAVARVCGEFLTALHATPQTMAIKAGVQREDGNHAPEHLWCRAADCLGAVRAAAAPALARRAERFTLRTDLLPTVSGRPLCVAHNDLSVEHILLDAETRLPTGVIDWTDIRIVDPAIDFAGLCNWLGEDFVKKTLEHYGGEADDGLVRRARFIAACFAYIDVHYCHLTAKPETLERGLRALERDLPNE